MTQPMKRDALQGRTQHPSPTDVMLSTAVFCALTTTIVLLWRQNTLLLAATLVEALVALRLWHERRDIVFFLVLAILGTCAEVVFVQGGVWRYANPSLFGIPVWFPPAFGTAGLACERLVAGLTR